MECTHIELDKQYTRADPHPEITSSFSVIWLEFIKLHNIKLYIHFTEFNCNFLTVFLLKYLLHCTYPQCDITCYLMLFFFVTITMDFVKQ